MNVRVLRLEARMLTEVRPEIQILQTTNDSRWKCCRRHGVLPIYVQPEMVRGG
ncbi:Hypothetical predicted protein, partial [Olea europaea subsp. europaea]|uniref:Uncharacterized protein n=1 Tax=Olea europaea subsp. europaea TaxID=158383 RepID=A0A8S0QCQ1_OLEEU